MPGDPVAETIDQARVTLKVGDPAPDFTLPTHNEGELNLAWYRGRRNVVLAFYPGDWTPVCANQISGYEVLMPEFEKYNCQLLAISVDSVPCHSAWAKAVGIASFPLMSDYYPHGEVARRYGVLSPRGYAERALFLIDKTGRIRYIDRTEIATIPDPCELVRQMAALPA